MVSFFILACCQYVLFSFPNKDERGVVLGAKIQDNLSNKKVDVYSRTVVNATGPFTDEIRYMADDKKPAIKPSAGVHITIPAYFGS